MRSESCTASVMLWVMMQRRLLQLLLDLQHLVAEQKPRLLVERGERLVHQHDLRLRRERARHRHALAHAAGEFRRIAALEAVEPDQRNEMPRALVALRLRQAGDLQRERDVVDHGAPGEGRLLLEDHADRGMRAASPARRRPAPCPRSRRAARR